MWDAGSIFSLSLLLMVADCSNFLRHCPIQWAIHAAWLFSGPVFSVVTSIPKMCFCAIQFELHTGLCHRLRFPCWIPETIGLFQAIEGSQYAWGNLRGHHRQAGGRTTRGLRSWCKRIKVKVHHTVSQKANSSETNWLGSPFFLTPQPLFFNLPLFFNPPTLFLNTLQNNGF